MIPGTLLGALFLIACLVPGFIFIRIEERKRARPPRSTLLEAVELAGVGAAASLVAATLVLLTFRNWILDVDAFATDPGEYLVLHPARGLGAVLATFVVSCVLVLVAAQVAFRGKDSAFKPGGTAWGHSFWDSREGRDVMVTVELHDGRRIMGKVATFTADFEDDRELALVPPLLVQAGPEADRRPLMADFLVVREAEIASIIGRYSTGPVRTDGPDAATAESDTSRTSRADRDASQRIARGPESPTPPTPRP